LSLLARLAPMWIDAARIPELEPGPPPVATEYLPGEEKSTVICAVASGLIGAVLASGRPADAPDGRIATDSAWVAWLVMMNSTGPAPTIVGDTDTRLLSMNTVRLTGAGGRGVVAPVALEPHAETATALQASIAIVVLLHILGVASSQRLSERRGIRGDPGAWGTLTCVIPTLRNVTPIDVNLLRR